MSSENQPEQAIREQAAEWAVRDSAGPLSDEQQRALEQWCAADPRHAQAYEFARTTWADLGALGQIAPPVRRASPSTLARPMPRRSRLRRAMTGVAALLVLALGAAQAPQLLLDWRADYITAAGEVRRVTLPDGSLVDLDSRSAITLAFDDRERRVRLLAGEAVFSAAPVSAHERRPFVVEYAGATTRALGTRFVVGQAGEGGWVGMLEHRVAVDLLTPPARGRADQVVEQGQSVRYDHASGVRPWPEQNLQRATDWERGVLVFERQPLAEVVARLNRYRPGRLMVVDSQLAQREVSGVFRLDQLAAVGGVLSDELQAQRLELPGLTLIY
ncbi:FecR family protein [Pseudomonas putida]|uniref:FecR family protein n=1 Tax=Pseudomonas putida TaxID=303 RepID=UPI00081947FF|nr:FecR domain-containing protein [Pseudomonas putida]OCT21424.1 siderophore-interacting protein [Pseudomonas putida]OCT23114.1 siderophore-interacting protein [Pseudomonas putida]OCT23196.1 siderophore-interacting protein [Pseudomonas putida]OCT36156.1 siderophore-interacting protein [Pseudomonas putida]